jgi:hypothetical protein
MCTNLKTLPDPTKPAWEQDPVIIDILMAVEKELYPKEDDP